MGFVNAGRSEPPGTEHKLHNAIRKGGVATAQERPVPNEVARPPSGGVMGSCRQWRQGAVPDSKVEVEQTRPDRYTELAPESARSHHPVRFEPR